MKKTARGICIWFIALALVFGNVMPALAQAEGTDTVTTEAELAQWCEDHDGIGGTVTLADNITITSPISGGYNGGHIIIDTGAFGLIYDGGDITLNDFEITGQGVNSAGIPTPVVEVRNLGRIWMGNWNNLILLNKITATGAPDGTGGIALRVNGVNNAAFDTGSVPNKNGRIQSFGVGAIGVEVMQPTDIHCLSIHVEGENSVAVSAPQGASLFYCRLSADGTGAVAVDGDVVLDACTASPEAEHTISRRIEAITGKSFFLPILQNKPIFTGSIYTFLLRGSDGSIRKEALYVDWDQAALTGIDTSVLGTTVVPGALPQVFSGFGLDDDFSLELTVEIWDPEVPCINDMFFSDDDGKAVAFPFFFTHPNITLYRSIDGGVTWEDYTNNPDIEWPEWGNDSFTYHYDEITGPIMFCVEVPEKGFSNVVTIRETDGVPVGDNGGDRTGTDRPGGGDTGNGDGNGNGGDNNDGDNNDGHNGGDGNNDGSGGDNNDNDNYDGDNNTDDNADNDADDDNEGGHNDDNSDKDNGDDKDTENENNDDGGAATEDTDDANLIAQNDEPPLQHPEPKGFAGIANVRNDKAVPVMGTQASIAQPFVSAQIPALIWILIGIAGLFCLIALVFLKLRALRVKP